MAYTFIPVLTSKINQKQTHSFLYEETKQPARCRIQAGWPWGGREGLGACDWAPAADALLPGGRGPPGRAGGRVGLQSGWNRQAAGVESRVQSLVPFFLSGKVIEHLQYLWCLCFYGLDRCVSAFGSTVLAATAVLFQAALPSDRVTLSCTTCCTSFLSVRLT